MKKVLYINTLSKEHLNTQMIRNNLQMMRQSQPSS
ncbi:hypothetical protein MAESPC_00325 [Microcystis aeruginosa SPC777]|uniref:Uncharacterized protein n=1 Tax=Microcystis aeruginosa SPC777 TaxID=482300 RepID=S3KGS6_MICAE|nr:hypothetical protein MAESPC_00932 [Microcystis aeruginosa SPC777]EPF24687.1 hypothetical protein MAESPC_00325 [Microcystis aeruginosa SPC777]